MIFPREMGPFKRYVQFGASRYVGLIAEAIFDEARLQGCELKHIQDLMDMLKSDLVFAELGARLTE